MTDLHTHILPAMDDGAKTVEESLKLLDIQQSHGIDTVVLTPHFYRSHESVDCFLARRKESMAQLRSAIDARSAELPPLPRVILGAEVLWRSDMIEWERLDELCIDGTRNMLLELPFTPWNSQMIDQLYDVIGHTGITPIIAHLERYIPIQSKSLVQEILDLGVPVQISSDVLKHPLERRESLKLLRKGRAHILASDCHDSVRRIPDLAEGLGVVRKKLGEQYVRELCDCADHLVCG